MTKEQIKLLIEGAPTGLYKNGKDVLQSWLAWIGSSHTGVDTALTWKGLNKYGTFLLTRRKVKDTTVRVYQNIIRACVIEPAIKRGLLHESALEESRSKMSRRAKVAVATNLTRSKTPRELLELMQVTNGTTAARLLKVPMAEFARYMTREAVPSPEFLQAVKTLTDRIRSKSIATSKLYPHDNDTKEVLWTRNEMTVRT